MFNLPILKKHSETYKIEIYKNLMALFILLEKE